MTRRSPSTFRLRRERCALAVAVLAFAGHAAGAQDATLVAALDQEADRLIAQMSQPSGPSELLALDAVVNGLPAGPMLVYTGGLGGIAIEDVALARLRIVVPDGAAIEFEGRRFVPLRALPGASATIQPRTQQIAITVPAQLFDASDVALKLGTMAAPELPPWSAFANYDLFGYTSKGSSYGSALLEAGVAGPYGVGVATAVVNGAEAFGGNTGKTTLLEAAWRYDDPASLRTLVAGTAISRTGAWGHSLRYAGVQYGTNFTLQPNLITYPIPAFGGTAVVPSTVDVLVNGMRVGSQQVPAGPFDITNVPVVTGTGDVQLVVRDAFGQQTVITQPFYASRQLLKPGLDDFTVSVGAERVNYGLQSFDFGSVFGSAYWRRGVTDTVSVELLGAADRDAQAAGATVDFVPGKAGVVTLGGAGSAGDAGGGALGIAGYEYIAPSYNFVARGSWASARFRVPGDDPGRALQRMMLVGGGYNFGSAGSLGIAWAEQAYRSVPVTSTTTVSYSVSLAPRLFFNASAARSTGATSQTTVVASLMITLDGQTFAGADVTSSRANGATRTTGGATVQRSLPIGEGYGYRVRATTDDQYIAGGVYAGPYGRYSAEVASQDGVTAARGNIAGGVGIIGGTAFASRPIVDSFALVRVDATPGVRVTQNGNFAGRTDERGDLVITQLAPYIATRVTIDDRDLPIDLTIATRERQVAPFFRSGAIVDFNARKLANALVEVRLPGGAPLPTGAIVTREGGSQAYPVGDGGEVFIPDLEYGVPYQARWNGSRCRFAVTAPQAGTEPMPRYGPLGCEALAP